MELNMSSQDVPSQTSFDMNNISAETLSSLEMNKMIQLVLVLKKENNKLKYAKLNYEARLARLERELNINKQYQRRDTIEIAGIPNDVLDDEIEGECLKILKAAKAKVGSKFPNTLDIHAAHRKKGKFYGDHHIC